MRLAGKSRFYLVRLSEYVVPVCRKMRLDIVIIPCSPGGWMHP